MRSSFSPSVLLEPAAAAAASALRLALVQQKRVVHRPQKRVLLLQRRRRRARASRSARAGLSSCLASRASRTAPAISSAWRSSVAAAPARPPSPRRRRRQALEVAPLRVQLARTQRAALGVDRDACCSPAPPPSRGPAGTRRRTLAEHWSIAPPRRRRRRRRRVASAGRGADARSFSRRSSVKHWRLLRSPRLSFRRRREDVRHRACSSASGGFALDQPGARRRRGRSPRRAACAAPWRSSGRSRASARARAPVAPAPDACSQIRHAHRAARRGFLAARTVARRHGVGARSCTCTRRARVVFPAGMHEAWNGVRAHRGHRRRLASLSSAGPSTPGNSGRLDERVPVVARGRAVGDALCFSLPGGHLHAPHEQHAALLFAERVELAVVVVTRERVRALLVRGAVTLDDPGPRETR